jgi:hypothetical protein
MWRAALFWVITQWVVVICYRRFVTTYRSHLQGPRNQKMAPERLFRNVGKRNYHFLLRNNPEERRSHLLCVGRRKSRRKKCYNIVLTYIYVFFNVSYTFKYRDSEHWQDRIFLQKVKTYSGAYPVSYSMGTKCYFLRNKSSRSHPPNVEGMGGAIRIQPPYALMAHRHSFFYAKYYWLFGSEVSGSWPRLVKFL